MDIHLSILNNASMNTHVCIFCEHVFSSCGYIPQNENAGLYGFSDLSPLSVNRIVKLLPKFFYVGRLRIPSCASLFKFVKMTI